MPYLEQETEYTIGQRIHLARRDLKGTIKSNYVLFGFGMGLVALILLIGIPAAQFMESFGVWEDRINSPEGPLCNTEDFNEPPYPAIIDIIPETAADQAGLIDGDIITRINDLPIDSFTTLSESWPDKFPNIRPGDFVEIYVQREGNVFPISVKTTAHESKPFTPFLGIAMYQEPVCSLWFTPNEETQFSAGDHELILVGIWSVVFIAVAFGIFLILGGLWYRPHISKLKKEMANWENDFLDQSYIMTFNTTPPTGSTNGKKIFDLAQIVFPELRKKTGRKAKWKGTMKGSNNYEFDCFQASTGKDSTEQEIFVAKHFGDTKVTFKKLQELCKATIDSLSLDSVKKKIKDVDKMVILRLICVGKNYEKQLVVDESWEDLRDDLDFEYPIDLIFENEDGSYEVNMIDYE